MMEQLQREELDKYYRDAASWSEDRYGAVHASRKLAWIVAGLAIAVAVLEAIALVMLAPLKTVVPYTLLVDRQTGTVETLSPLDKQIVTPDTALVRSFLAQYVVAREGFDIDTLNANYRKVALWSAEDARSQYLSAMQPNNPLSPLKAFPRRALVEIQVRSVSPLNADTALVRFAMVQSHPGSQPQPAQLWASVVKYRFSNAGMSAEDRMTNPLGFQVLRYHRDAELAPAPTAAAPAQLPMPNPRQAPPTRQQASPDPAPGKVQ